MNKLYKEVEVPAVRFRVPAIFAILVAAMAISLSAAADEFDDEQKAQLKRLFVTICSLIQKALVELDRRQRESDAALSGAQISKNTLKIFA